jgi:ribosomal protein S18 acetylase RimI-like enzyme
VQFSQTRPKAVIGWQQSMEKLRDSGLRLYVENSNERAQDTYRAFKMTQPYLVMESLFGNQEEE